MTNSLSGWYVASITPPVNGCVSKHVYVGWTPCIDWCKEQFGNNAIDGWRFIGEGVFEFRDEKMLTLFLLRWA